jgi:murein DD-endopeptidase MepM/ murein hydrolase activator NlpD
LLALLHRSGGVSLALGGLILAVHLFVPATPARAQSYKSVPMADGFDYPVGKPNADGYYLRRGFYPNAHMGEDWNGNGGGNTDYGDPVYAIGHGLCVYSQNYGSSWGNLVVLRHAYREKNGRVYFIDSFYAHLAKRSVSVGSTVSRGQVVGTIGTAGGIYVAHLHFEIRKNLAIGPWQSSHAKTYANYHSPRHFIEANRNLRRESRRFSVPINTFSKTATSPNNVASAGRVEIPTRGVPDRSRPQVPPPVQGVIEKQGGNKEQDSRGWWQRFKSRIGFGKDK